jgi:arabinofuranan 3-O-arabinosyltransferase
LLALVGVVEEPPLPVFRVQSQPGGGYRVQVAEATGPYHLVIGQNWSSGWEASIDGTSLGEPLLIDGYSAGWRIDRPGAYTVDVRYAPQSAYVAALLVTGLFVLITAVALASGVIRRWWLS